MTSMCSLICAVSVIVVLLRKTMVAKRPVAQKVAPLCSHEIALLGGGCRMGIMHRPYRFGSNCCASLVFGGIPDRRARNFFAVLIRYQDRAVLMPQLRSNRI